MSNPYGEKLSAVNNFSLVLADDCLQDFTVVAGTILIDPVPQRLLGHLQETFLDLYHVNLYKEAIRMEGLTKLQSMAACIQKQSINLVPYKYKLFAVLFF